MTREDLDVLWNRALQESVKAGEHFTRYHFAALVAAAEREECAKVCDNMVMYGPVAEVQQRYNKAYADCRDAIRAREKQ